MCVHTHTHTPSLTSEKYIGLRFEDMDSSAGLFTIFLSHSRVTSEFHSHAYLYDEAPMTSKSPSRAIFQ